MLWSCRVCVRIEKCLLIGIGNLITGLACSTGGASLLLPRMPKLSSQSCSSGLGNLDRLATIKKYSLNLAQKLFKCCPSCLAATFLLFWMKNPNKFFKVSCSHLVTCVLKYCSTLLLLCPCKLLPEIKYTRTFK